MTTTAPAQDTPRFHATRRAGLRRARPWHRLAYIAWLLPRRLESLTAMLNVPRDGHVLDYGCAEQPYRRFFAPTVAFVGADLPGNPDADVTISADGLLPVDDEAFDAVLSTQVLEHVADPVTYLEECRRVLRPGGRLLLSTHGMMVYHPDPVDYWRWTWAGLERIVDEAGLEVVHREGIMGLGAVGLQFVQDSLYHRVPRRLRAPVALLFQTLILLSDRMAPAGRLDGNALVFAIVAQRPSLEHAA
jgi:SAM-dependent methyltransferase